MFIDRDVIKQGGMPPCQMLVAILFLLLLSCNSATSPITDNDFDSQLSTDRDSDLSTHHDSDVTTDSDVDTQPPCEPSLMEAPFPYYDKEGNMTFCRPECDTPTEKDPQCLTNLWKEQNLAFCKAYPQYDCCGLPCVKEDFSPLTKDELYTQYPETEKYVPMHTCDLYLPLWDNDSTNGVVKSWNMSDGKVGFYLRAPLDVSSADWPVKSKFVTYDIASQTYRFVTAARGQGQAYHKGRRIALTSDKRSIEQNNENIYLTYIGDDGSVELVNNKKMGLVLSYEPALNEKWVFVNFQEAGTLSKMAYAKVGAWKWTILGEGNGWFSALVGNHLSIVDDDVNAWICDLSKSPQKLSDCTKFNQEGEQIEYLYFDREDENRFIFYNTGKQKLVLAEKDGDGYKRTDVITEFTEESRKNAFSLLPRTLRGNILLYEEVTTDGSVSGGLLCFYNIATKKKQCMKKMDRDESYADGTTRYPYGYAEFEGKWLLYQKRNSTPLILRDMECYCKEEGICPFEE